MKKLLLTFVLIAGFATLSFGQITGSKHDFSAAAWNNSVGDQICIVCHTPHNAMTISGGGAPLWNHRESTTPSFTVYASTTMNATVGQPSGTSKLCLGCHDGSVGVSDFGGVTAGLDKLTSSDNGYLGSNLSNDHPISFTYDAALASTDVGLFDPITTTSGLPGGSTIDVDLLFGHKLECASCHDVHGTANDYLLRVDNAGSALCLTCHDK